MSPSNIRVGSVAMGWQATQMSADGDYLYWSTPDGTLYRARLTQGGLEEGAEKVASGWTDGPFAVAGERIYWPEGDNVLKAARIDDGRLGEAEIASSDWRATHFTADDSHLYWTEDDGKLRRSPVVDGTLDSGAQVVASDWKGTRFAVGNGQVSWSEGDGLLHYSRIEGDTISESREVIAQDWEATLMTGAGDRLLWTDSENHLRWGEKLAGNGNYIHFQNAVFDWDEVQWMTANVRGPGEFGYYNTGLSGDRPTGVPYEPKHQDYWYSVEYTLQLRPSEEDPRPPFQRAYMQGYFKVDERSKLAVLRRKEGAKPDNLVVEIQDF